MCDKPQLQIACSSLSRRSRPEAQQCHAGAPPAAAAQRRKCNNAACISHVQVPGQLKLVVSSDSGVGGQVGPARQAGARVNECAAAVPAEPETWGAGGWNTTASTRICAAILCSTPRLGACTDARAAAAAAGQHAGCAPETENRHTAQCLDTPAPTQHPAARRCNK